MATYRNTEANLINIVAEEAARGKVFATHAKHGYIRLDYRTVEFDGRTGAPPCASYHEAARVFVQYAGRRLAMRAIMAGRSPRWSSAERAEWSKLRAAMAA